MRKIAVLDRFLNEKHRAAINETAEKYGFTVEYFRSSTLPAGTETEYEVLYGLPALSQLKSMTHLKWFCAGFAGVDLYTDDALYPNPEVLLTNSSGAYGVTISEHIIMVTLMLLRQYPAFKAVVDAHQWVQEMPMRSICGSRITVLGIGDIGTSFAVRAKAMGAAHICGVRRSSAPGPDCYDEVISFDKMDSVLPKTDILVMALPATPETVGILSKSRLALLSRHAIVVNVGRGNAIDQEALMDALNQEQIAGAALDVMVPEPLPKDHPLWDTKHLLITPHCSGNFSLDITRDKHVTMFCEDLENYAAGKPLAHLVDRKRGY